MNQEEKIANSLLKKALGYMIDEVVEEYANEDNELKLIKKKVTKKHIPPDVSAAKELVELIKNQKAVDWSNYTEQDLLKMRDNLLKEIKENSDASAFDKSQDKM